MKRVEALLVRHKDAVYQQMVRVCGNHADAEDALGEAILTACRSLDQIRDPGSFRPWLIRVGSRCCARQQVRRRLREAMSLEHLASLGIEFAGSAATEDEMATKECILTAIEALPDSYRSVYVSRMVDGLSTEAVAAKYGITPDTVRVRLYRARQRIRAALDGALD